MTTARRMLLETLAGHLALLQTADPRKAKTPTARAARKYVNLKLRCEKPRPGRLAA